VALKIHSNISEKSKKIPTIFTCINWVHLHHVDLVLLTINWQRKVPWFKPPPQIGSARSASALARKQQNFFAKFCHALRKKQFKFGRAKSVEKLEETQ
jgi:hypothetical protein